MIWLYNLSKFTKKEMKNYFLENVYVSNQIFPKKEILMLI